MLLNKKKILVADDDEAILDALILILEDAGYEVEATNNGMTIHDSLNNSPDLLLLDIRMSGWNGRDICRYLKSQEETKDIPIILFSANRDTQKMAREAGADGFITKLFDIDELLAKIEQLV